MAGVRERVRTSAATLVLANAVPLAGVVALGWDLHSLLVVYWLESAVVGAFTVPKMIHAGGGTEADEESVRLLRLGLVLGRIAFFCVHYGIFWVVHGVFVLRFPAMFPDLAWASPGVVAAGTVGLVVSHAVSYRRNFVGGREYARTSPKRLMSAPYRRVVVLHLTVILGAFAIAAVDAPVGALAVMVVVKTALDLRAHWREHRPGQSGLPV